MTLSPPIQPSRPSTSSQRSRQDLEATFEAALLSPSTTYLSVSPVLPEETTLNQELALPPNHPFARTSQSKQQHPTSQHQNRDERSGIPGSIPGTSKHRGTGLLESGREDGNENYNVFASTSGKVGNHGMEGRVKSGRGSEDLPRETGLKAWGKGLTLGKRNNRRPSTNQQPIIPFDLEDDYDRPQTIEKRSFDDDLLLSSDDLKESRKNGLILPQGALAPSVFAPGIGKDGEVYPSVAFPSNNVQDSSSESRVNQRSPLDSGNLVFEGNHEGQERMDDGEIEEDERRGSGGESGESREKRRSVIHNLSNGREINQVGLDGEERVNSRDAQRIEKRDSKMGQSQVQGLGFGVENDSGRYGTLSTNSTITNNLSASVSLSTNSSITNGLNASIPLSTNSTITNNLSASVRGGRRGSTMTTNTIGTVGSTGTIGTVGTGSDGTPSKLVRKQKQAIGLDAEIKAQNPKPPKKKSIFRSPGTASSPDLATLVRRAKEPKSNTDTSPSSQQTPPSNVKTGAGPSRPTGHVTELRSPGRERTVSHGEGLHGDHWDRGSNVDVRSMNSGVSTITGRRSREGSTDDAFKSMRSKAKGVFGRMFGTTQPTPNPHSYSHSSPSHPPVPPIPPGLVPHPKTPQHSPPDHNAISPTSKSSSSSKGTPEKRRFSPNNNMSHDKPLPPLQHQSSSPAPSKTSISNTPTLTESNTMRRISEIRKSGHIRQPADTIFEGQEQIRSPISNPSNTNSPGPATMDSFTRTVDGMFDLIGQSDVARELGLPPESVRSKSKSRNPDKTRSLDLEVPKDIHGKILSDLGRSNSHENRKRLVTENKGERGQNSPVPGFRTTSLPNTSPSLPPSPKTKVDSGIRPKASSDPPEEIIRSKPVTPILVTPNDFGPLLIDKDATIKAKPETPLSPGTVKLVTQREELGKLGIDTSAGNDTTDTGRPGPSAFGGSSVWRQQSQGHGKVGSDTVKEEEDETVTTPTNTMKEDDEEKGRRLACEFLEDDFSHISQERVAEFLGGPRPVNQIALRYYMQYFNMKGLNLVDAFRDLCKKLHLKAESQEIDRIIEAFSARYYHCNPTTVFGSPGIVHTVTGAMLMLNTDLHIADLSKHMSRSDFIRNALRAIQESRPSTEGSSTPELIRDDSSSLRPYPSTTSVGQTSSVRTKPLNRSEAPQTQRSASAPIVNVPHLEPAFASQLHLDPRIKDSSTTISSFSYSKAWESEAENALKEIYSSVRTDRILLPTGSNLSAGDNRKNNRQSILSIASSTSPYETGRNKTLRSPSQRGRNSNFKRGSVMGGLGTSPYVSTYSSDGRLSPTPSYSASIHETQYSSFTPTIGFASNLSHTVIRETKETDSEAHSIASQVSQSSVSEMNDDELALLGAPWAKEGLLSRRLYIEAGGKKASKKEWKQFFVVVSLGELYMFTFGEGSKGGSGFAGGSVGGGNWMNNANAIGQISLMHTMSLPLPHSGYSASRPHCFSLSQPNGEINFFQAGTADLVTEWTATCNYWAARRSRQPLQGGVSNMEYGWSRAIAELEGGDGRLNTNRDEDDRASVKSRSSSMFGSHSQRRKVSGEKNIHINDWKPPPAATMPSPLDEESQLETLQTYVRSLTEEIERHRALQDGVNRSFMPNSRNAQKAKDNFRAKNLFLHSEIYKYQQYVESLRKAIILRVQKQGEKKLEKSLTRSSNLLQDPIELRPSSNINSNLEPDPNPHPIPSLNSITNIDSKSKFDSGDITIGNLNVDGPSTPARREEGGYEDSDRSGGSSGTEKTNGSGGTDGTEGASVKRPSGLNVGVVSGDEAAERVERVEEMVEGRITPNALTSLT
ncbi:hypothetical protein M231_00450 [Tremella mesenterica]|uniref:SEC7 domain-containing protein n=1 Tax=Tremella mesenterica TaxID=5217 RepID=A0A4Q1BVC3_TREME|nr:hypothetical protein M231_00450 [Tremella mesenterica]